MGREGGKEDECPETSGPEAYYGSEFPGFPHHLPRIPDRVSQKTLTWNRQEANIKSAKKSLYPTTKRPGKGWANSRKYYG